MNKGSQGLFKREIVMKLHMRYLNKLIFLFLVALGMSVISIEAGEQSGTKKERVEQTRKMLSSGWSGLGYMGAAAHIADLAMNAGALGIALKEKPSSFALKYLNWQKKHKLRFARAGGIGFHFWNAALILLASEIVTPLFGIAHSISEGWPRRGFGVAAKVAEVPSYIMTTAPAEFIHRDPDVFEDFSKKTTE